MIFVTIGIPTYNVGRFIGQTIKSIVGQTHTNFELIITDDGSTDNTVEEIRKFKDSRIKLIVDGENHGISYRLNQQINLAKGKYFVRMDGDDLMFPDRVEKEVAYLEQHPKVDVVGAGAVIIDDDNNIIGQRQGHNNHRCIKDYATAPCFIHPTVCGKVDWFRKYKYKEEFNGVEDCNLWLRGAADGSNYYTMQMPLMFYRDPEVFKLRTYLKRLAQARKMLLSERGLIQDDVFLVMYNTKSYVKVLIACVLSFFKLDRIMIKRRNDPFRDENHNTISILESVLK